jgi:hypothetical protein
MIVYQLNNIDTQKHVASDVLSFSISFEINTNQPARMQKNNGDIIL